jgi:hypothetical protein
MKKNQQDERLQYPRLNQQLPVKIAANGYDFMTSTENISCVGAYCRINKYVPPFTRISLKITLPVNEGKAKKDYHVECRGVIVRTDDEASGAFNVAIFFNGISDANKQKISHYISQFLPN